MRTKRMANAAGVATGLRRELTATSTAIGRAKRSISSATRARIGTNRAHCGD